MLNVPTITQFAFLNLKDTASPLREKDLPPKLRLCVLILNTLQIGGEFVGITISRSFNCNRNYSANLRQDNWQAYLASPSAKSAGPELRRMQALALPPLHRRLIGNGGPPWLDPFDQLKGVVERHVTVTHSTNGRYKSFVPFSV